MRESTQQRVREKGNESHTVREGHREEKSRGETMKEMKKKERKKKKGKKGRKEKGKEEGKGNGRSAQAGNAGAGDREAPEAPEGWVTAWWPEVRSGERGREEWVQSS